MKPHREGRWEDKVTLRYPASWWRNLWREALPAGNGVLGASVFGGVQDETVLLNHAALWHWGQRDELPDVSFTLKETRRLMDEKRYLEASWQLADALKERGYGTKLASRFPLAAIRLTMPGEQAFRSYRRELDMDSGQITVAWKDGERLYSRLLFVSRADDCLVYRIGEAGGRSLRRNRPGASSERPLGGYSGIPGAGEHGRDRGGRPLRLVCGGQRRRHRFRCGYASYTGRRLLHARRRPAPLPKSGPGARARESFCRREPGGGLEKAEGRTRRPDSADRVRRAGRSPSRGKGSRTPLFPL
ncbi:glycoside hydrolase family 95 protein [Paenibacillus sp. CC-CFT747]|nr:glycoside hydrolase family 95 protein [Paenibacillus sp. CC-CFT747]